MFGLESVAADPDRAAPQRCGVTCPRCRSKRTARNDNDREDQRYLCKNSDHTFHDKIGMNFAQAKSASDGDCFTPDGDYKVNSLAKSEVQPTSW